MGTYTQANNISGKPSVLVVDDEAGPRDALKVILRPFFTIHSAENAKSALEVLKDQHIDLITLDQKLPDRQGIDLLQDIKHDHSDVEVIIITGYGSLKSAMEGIRHGAAGYLLKPFNVTELITLINQTLEKKQRLDYLRSFLRTSTALWGTEQETARAWKDIQSNYFGIGKSSGESEAASGDATSLIPLLSDLLEAKDRQLLNHSSRVSFYASLLANRLNLPVAEQKALALGAFLHDIGKIAQADYSFKAEYQTRGDQVDGDHQHPDIGSRMLLPLGFPAEVGQIVAYHHERFDGLGYPHGLRGEGIPLLARIVSIAQAFDNLTVDVPGRQPLSIDDAIRQITLQADTHFDPMLTELFARVVRECKSSLPALAIAATPTSNPEP
ncbi:MAG: response regulator [Nitrospiraceae bacterium]|nr:response regulator [Nitrospiraceae bacterium]